jgi:hypothetical protein
MRSELCGDSPQAKAALADRLKEIDMSTDEASAYDEYLKPVSRSVVLSLPSPSCLAGDVSSVAAFLFDALEI